MSTIDDEEEMKDYGLIEKCSNLVTDENRCLDTWDDENADYKECKRINCYKKQLQRLKKENEDILKIIDCKNGTIATLESENEKLKKEVKDIGTNFIKKGDYSRKLENKLKSEKFLKENAMQEASKYAIICGEYKTALEDIRGIAKTVITASNCSNCDGVGYYDGCEDVTCGDYATRKIFEKINEVLNNDTSA